MATPERGALRLRDLTARAPTACLARREPGVAERDVDHRDDLVHGHIAAAITVADAQRRTKERQRDCCGKTTGINGR
jgi:hypothetical protein